jgi:hypothetical protein
MKKMTALFWGCVALLYILTIRGDVGIPTPKAIEYDLSAAGRPFETSQERSRYAMILSLYYDKTIRIDRFASMGTPDIGKLNGHYYSFFPPAVSVLALPLFVLGVAVGAPQMMVFSLSTIAAIVTMISMIHVGLKLGLSKSASLFGAFAFGFATNAWGYSVTLYAHLVSAALLISAVYVLLFAQKTWWRPVLLWLLYGGAVCIDFPNLFIFAPVAVYLIQETVSLKQYSDRYVVTLDWKMLMAPIVFFLCIGAYGYYNYVNFGNPLTLSNALPRVKDLKIIDQSIPETGKDAVTALNTRNLLTGLVNFTVSRDRGVLWYSPVIVLFVFALWSKKRRNGIIVLTMLSVAAVCLTLYSLFGDPYGGWAFGSRYLIAIMPELCILAAMGLSEFGRSIWVKSIYTIVFVYSAAVSLLAPLTTNVIPPQVEATHLGLDSDYRINIRMLQKNTLNSYIYHVAFAKTMSGVTYYTLILTLTAAVGVTLIWSSNGETARKKGDA